MQNIKVWETPKVSETDHKGEKPFSRSWERRVNEMFNDDRITQRLQHKALTDLLKTMQSVCSYKPFITAGFLWKMMALFRLLLDIIYTPFPYK